MSEFASTIPNYDYLFSAACSPYQNFFYRLRQTERRVLDRTSKPLSIIKEEKINRRDNNKKWELNEKAAEEKGICCFVAGTATNS